MIYAIKLIFDEYEGFVFYPLPIVPERVVLQLLGVFLFSLETEVVWFFESLFGEFSYN